MATTATEPNSLSAAAAVLGDKWTPELLRFFLKEDTVRFCELQDFTGGINPRTLSARLARLEEQGIIIKEPGSSVHRCTYRLTKKGEGLLPILGAMQQWSSEYS